MGLLGIAGLGAARHGNGLVRPRRLHDRLDVDESAAHSLGVGRSLRHRGRHPGIGRTDDRACHRGEEQAVCALRLFRPRQLSAQRRRSRRRLSHRADRRFRCGGAAAWHGRRIRISPRDLSGGKTCRRPVNAVAGDRRRGAGDRGIVVSRLPAPRLGAFAARRLRHDRPHVGAVGRVASAVRLAGHPLHLCDGADVRLAAPAQRKHDADDAAALPQQPDRHGMRRHPGRVVDLNFGLPAGGRKLAVLWNSLDLLAASKLSSLLSSNARES